MQADSMAGSSDGRWAASWLPRQGPSNSHPASGPCQCQSTSALAGYELDRTTPLRGTMAHYNTQVLVSTGKKDWNSKIELEDGLAAELKGVLGKAGLKKGFGHLRDPNNTIIATNSSYPPSPAANELPGSHASAYIFPQNLYLPVIPLSHSPIVPSAGTLDLISTYLLPSSPPPSALMCAPSIPIAPRKVHEMHILVCSHNSRDERCGIIGPILHDLFTECLESRGLLHPMDPDMSIRGKVRVSCISHIGGHKYAGNVVVYLPPDEDKWDHGGKGIWYGRVEEVDVDRIVSETVENGRVIEELFRGGVGL
ncbi:Sucraseferredoxin-like protein [Peziza echinospora]|nr:Sucraseferredoxin-like protein [Peziza echinospora]